MEASQDISQTPRTPADDKGRLSWCERHCGFKTWKLLAALGGVVAGAFYISNLLFGNASLEVLMHLESYESNLKSEISRLKKENAALQKEYFELKELEPAESDKK